MFASTNVFRQQYTALAASWQGVDEKTGIPFGLTTTFMNPGEVPADAITRKVFWGEFSVREMYEGAGIDYFVFLCQDAKEVTGVLNAMKSGVQAPDGATWWPCWSTFGDKGNHIVFVRGEKMYPSAWMARLGLKAVLNSKGDRFWKFMKRFRRATAHPELFAKMNVLSVQENWKDRSGWTMLTLVNPAIVDAQSFTVLLRPMIHGADGQSFCTAAGVKKAWDRKTGPLDMFSLGGTSAWGSIKGHMLVVTPNKQLPADFVISDPKDEMVMESRDTVYLNIQFHCHRYHFARTDTQSVLHYGFEPMLPGWSQTYLAELKEDLLDAKIAARMLGDVELDDDGDPVGVEDTAWLMEQVACFYKQTQFEFTKIPYIFRALVNMKAKSLRDLAGSNDRNAVRIELPRSLFTRRYIAVWEDVIDETGLETDPTTHMQRKGECFMNFADGMYSGDVVTWRQPNGYWRFNILKAIGPINFILIYGEDIYRWMQKSPAIFVPAEDQHEMLENWDGADFDDNVIVGRGDQIVNHFRALPAFPEERPDVKNPVTTVPAHFQFTWRDVVPFLRQAEKMKGIGYYCNRWMTGNYMLRLGLTDSKYSYLLSNVTAKFNLLGKSSELIVDSHTKLGGLGLDWANQIIETFESELKYLSPFFIWKDKAGDLRSRMGAKVAARIMGNGGIVRLPIDESVSLVQEHVSEFEAWADKTYCTLPSTWGLDPILYGMDSYRPEDENLNQWTGYTRNLWASLMKSTYGIHDQTARIAAFKSANTQIRDLVSDWTYKGTVGVIAGLWQQIYHPDNLRTKADRSGRSRYECEDLLWSPGMVHETLAALEGITKYAPAFPTNHQFMVTFDIQQKLQSNAITMDQVGKWITLGVKHVQVSLRPGTENMEVFLPVQGRGDVLIGNINDRNALRCSLFNNSQPITATLSPRMLNNGTPSINCLLADVVLTA